MKKIKVNLKDRSYFIFVGNKIFARLPRFLSSLKIGKDAVIITNPTITDIYSALIKNALIKSDFTVDFQSIPDTEKSKSMKEAADILERIAAYDKRRKIFIIALGGGVVGDLTGFVASVYRRGIPYVQVPTTLLSQIDSAIGGKTAVDLDVAKNQAGTFYQPRLVFSDVSFLQSLDKRQVISGLAEAVKYAIIKDKKLFLFLEKNYKKIIALEPRALEFLVYRCGLIKANIVSTDETEKKGLRTVLNFGHTIGHAIEASGSYELYNHGEAVGLGILAACSISKYLKILNSKTENRIKDLITSVGLPTQITGIYLPDILKAYIHDKKFIGKTNRFVLLKNIGSTIIKENVPLEVIERALTELG